MTKKQTLQYLSLGLFVGLFLTACVGVATGQVGLVGGPLVPVGQGPAIDLPSPQGELQPPADAQPLTPAHTMHTGRALETMAVMHSSIEAFTGHHCERP